MFIIVKCNTTYGIDICKAESIDTARKCMRSMLLDVLEQHNDGSDCESLRAMQLNELCNGIQNHTIEGTDPWFPEWFTYDDDYISLSSNEDDLVIQIFDLNYVDSVF